MVLSERRNRRAAGHEAWTHGPEGGASTVRGGLDETRDATPAQSNPDVRSGDR
jgi:hypothetical protein